MGALCKQVSTASLENCGWGWTIFSLAEITEVAIGFQLVELSGLHAFFYSWMNDLRNLNFSHSQKAAMFVLFKSRFFRYTYQDRGAFTGSNLSES